MLGPMSYVWLALELLALLSPLAMDMAVDVMFDRGFGLRVEERTHEYRFKIPFPPPQLNNLATERHVPPSRPE